MRSSVSLALLMLLLGALCAPPTALSADEQPADPDQRRRWRRPDAPDPYLMQRPPPSPKTLERHAKALEHLFEERYQEARQELDKLYFSRLNVAEQAMIHRDYAYIANAEGDRPEARKRLEAAISTGGFLPEETRDARFQIGMLWMQDENWSKASETLELWFSEEPNPNSASYYLLALCYYQQEDFPRALEAARKAVEIADEPKESWLQLLLALYLLEKDYASGLPVIEDLLALYPSKSYLMNLSTLHGALGDYAEAAIPLQLAHARGLLDSDEELRRLGQLLLFLNQPHDAALLLEKGIEEDVIEAESEVLAMLSNSWIAAREYDAAVAPLETAAGLSENGELYVRLAQVHVQRENWEQAAGALRKALAKGGLIDAGKAEILMGIALYSQEEPAEARRWFARASRFDGARGEAKVWIEHIDREIGSASDAAQPDG